MNTRITHAAATLALALLLLPAAGAADGKTNGNADAARILRQMSSQIGGAQRLTFEAHRQIDPALLAGRKEPEDARISVAVLRPNKIRAKSVSKDDVREFYADGVNLSMLDVKHNLYAIVPMYGSIDTVISNLEEKYGFTPPVVEFALSNIYQDVRKKAQSISYLGEGAASGGFMGLGGTACHRLQLTGKAADAELWVGVADSLPRKLVATFKNRPGKPQIRVEFSHWDLRSKVTEQQFVFVRPQGAQKVQMKTTAEMFAHQSKS